ncbi:MAG: 6-phosphogluconate dehydrogenase [Tardiphaga sp.]|jgi:putative dehydrogenase|nr:6-phosphogluconate dehydrogenase [Tardiphaga sp.]
MTPTIAVIAAGAMGSAIAARLTRHGATVLTSLEGRGAKSRARAEAAGMQHVDDQRLVEEASVILSIVPPAEAEALAERFAARLGGAAHAPIFVDCNAVSVSTMISIGRGLEQAGARLVDGAIIGLPPKGDERGPTIYFSGAAAGELAGLSEYGLDVRLVDGPVGAASALKLSYAGITKGLVAIATTMILAADRAGAGPALKAELAASQPQLLERFARTLPDMYPKAYRWVEEMHAISDFVGDGFPESIIFEGAASLYTRLADDVAGDRAACERIDAFFST